MAGRKQRRSKPLGAGDLPGADPQPVGGRKSAKAPRRIVAAEKRSKSPDDRLPLQLSRPQRESLITWTRIRNSLKGRLQEAGEDARAVGFTEKELAHLDEELTRSVLYAPPPHIKRLVAVLRRIDDLRAANADAQEEDAGVRKTAPKSGPLLYQFRITLLQIEPKIWRRIQIPDGTLEDLHDGIQASMGWEEAHLHQFFIDGERFGPPPYGDVDFEMDMIDETEVPLRKLIPRSGRKPRWIYEYDFGDCWRHEIAFEGFPTAEPKAKYPRCTDGARACPPEDCGGPWGYPHYLEAIADPDHEDHEDMLNWRGPFDPERFDAGEATKEMRKRRRR